MWRRRRMARAGWRRREREAECERERSGASARARRWGWAGGRIFFNFGRALVMFLILLCVRRTPPLWIERSVVKQ